MFSNRIFSRSLRALLAGFVLLLTPLACVASDIVVGSWNIQRLGHGENKSFQALATIASKIDLLAVQEVMTEEGLQRLVTQLEKNTGEQWGSIVSHALGSSSYKEMYAFVWRESAVEYADGAVVYLDRQSHFIREPLSAKFRSKRDNSELAIGTVHILYGKGIKDRVPEIKALKEYWLWMEEVYPGTPIALVGDFNLSPSNSAWAPLKSLAQPLITSGATTLSSHPGKYANLYDNIWIERKSQLVVSEAGIIDFPKIIGWNHKKSRKHVSDHAPVYMGLGTASLNGKAVNLALLQSAESTGTDNQTVPLASPLEIRGNRRSNIFHRADCPSFNRVSEKNLVHFESAQEAVAAGFRLAGNCP